MRTMYATTTAIAAIAMLAACGSDTSAADTDGDGQLSQEEVAAEAGKVKIEPGQWESTMEITEVNFDESQLPPEARGMAGAMLQGMIGQKQTSKNCITPEEAAKPEAGFFNSGENQDCTYDEFSMSGGKLTIDMVCTDENTGSTANMQMSGTYSSNQYALDTNFTGSAGEMGDMNFKAKTSGKRIGECPS